MPATLFGHIAIQRSIRPPLFSDQLHRHWGGGAWATSPSMREKNILLCVNLGPV